MFGSSLRSEAAGTTDSSVNVHVFHVDDELCKQRHASLLWFWLCMILGKCAVAPEEW